MSTYAFDEAKNLLNLPNYKVWFDKISLSASVSANSSDIPMTMSSVSSEVNELYSYVISSTNIAVGLFIHFAITGLSGKFLRALLFSNFYDSSASHYGYIVFYLPQNITLSSSYPAITGFDITSNSGASYLDVYIASTVSTAFSVTATATIFTVEF